MEPFKSKVYARFLQWEQYAEEVLIPLPRLSGICVSSLECFEGHVAKKMYFSSEENLATSKRHVEETRALRNPCLANELSLVASLMTGFHKICVSPAYELRRHFIIVCSKAR